MTSEVKMTLATCRLPVPTSEHLGLNAETDTEFKFNGDSNRSKFGELSKLALQVWLPTDS